MYFEIINLGYVHKYTFFAVEQMLKKLVINEGWKRKLDAG